MRGANGPTMGCWVPILSSHIPSRGVQSEDPLQEIKIPSDKPWPLARAEPKASCLRGQNPQQGQRHFWLSVKKTMFMPRVLYPKTP